jgi:hypothetical protein
MSKENRNHSGNFILLGSAFLFMSSYWVDDKKTAVNRRYVALAGLTVGLYYKF